MLHSDLTLYEQLERLPAGCQQSQTQKAQAQDTSLKGELIRWLSRIGHQLTLCLLLAQEPRIRKVDDAQSGQTLYDAYDPVINQHIRGKSEEALRIWLEQRYYVDSRSR